MKVGVPIPWNATPICEIFTDLLSDGKTPCESFWQPFKGPIIPFGSLVEYHPLSLRRTSQESINLERKSYLDCSLATLCTRGEFWMGDFLVADLWGVGDDGRIGNLLEKTQCERGDISHRKLKFIFPVEDGRIKTLGGDQELRTSTSIRHRPILGESYVDCLGESEGSLPQPQDSLPDTGEAINDFWSISGSFIYRHHVEPRVKLYSPREESFPIPLKYIDVSRTTHTMITGISMGLETCLLLGQVSLSLLYRKKNLQTDICGPGRDITRKQLTSRPDHFWPEL